MENTVLGEKFIEFAKYVKHWQNKLFDIKNGLFFTPEWRSLEFKNPISRYFGNEYELSAFAHFGFTQPTNFLTLVDTYNVLESGVPNFLAVACAMIDNCQTPNGIRLDSGDLALLSKQIHEAFDFLDAILVHKFDVLKLNPEAKYTGQIKRCKVCVSNDIKESTIVALM